MKSLRSKFVGSLVSLAMGDFLGAGAKRYTDDTAMMIGVAQSLIKNKGFNGEDLAQTFVKNYDTEPWRGYGPGPPQIFRMIKSGRKWNENLCDQFQGTGCDANGGCAQYTLVSEDFAYSIPERLNDLEAAPLMCAGAIGWRALKLTGIEDGETLGLYGFGASAHIVIQIVKYKYPNSKVFVFTRERDDEPSHLAKKLSADWVGVTGEIPPEKLNRAIDTTPVWKPPFEALKAFSSILHKFQTPNFNDLF